MQQVVHGASVPTGVVNALTVDVEDYFQVSALAPHFPPETWDRQSVRVERNVERILELFAQSGARATFFTLGWIAERYPAVVRSIVAAGHELASHGHAHQRASDQSPEVFLEDISRAKRLLEDIGGQPVNGYRAPSFSIGVDNQWAFDCIREAGYRYSSSVYPVKHDHYGIPDAPRFPWTVRSGLIEVPISTAPIMRRNLPAGGGGYFRLLPYDLSAWMIRRVNERDGRPTIFYFHPWEIDAAQPRVAGTKLKTRFRHYVNLDRMEGKLRRLLSDFRWDRMDRAFVELAQ